MKVLSALQVLFCFVFSFLNILNLLTKAMLQSQIQFEVLSFSPGADLVWFSSGLRERFGLSQPPSLFWAHCAEIMDGEEEKGNFFIDYHW